MVIPISTDLVQEFGFMKPCLKFLSVLFFLLPLATKGLASADHPLGWLAEQFRSKEQSNTANSFLKCCELPRICKSPLELDPVAVGKLYLDMDASYGIKGGDCLKVKAFEVLDDVSRREKHLDEAWKKMQPDMTNQPNFKATYNFLKYRMRVAEGLAKVAVAQKMASPEMRSYSIQAMEAGIDCLQAAARSRDELERVKKKSDLAEVRDLDAAAIRGIRKSLLDIWHTAQTTGSLDPILKLDLNEIVRANIKDKDQFFNWLNCK